MQNSLPPVQSVPLQAYLIHLYFRDVSLGMNTALFYIFKNTFTLLL